MPVMMATLPSRLAICFTKLFESALPASSQTPMVTTFIASSNKRAAPFPVACMSQPQTLPWQGQGHRSRDCLFQCLQPHSMSTVASTFLDDLLEELVFKAQFFKATTVLIGAEMSSGLAFWSKTTLETNQVLPWTSTRLQAPLASTPCRYTARCWPCGEEDWWPWCSMMRTGIHLLCTIPQIRYPNS